jgi:hypothetical protein
MLLLVLSAKPLLSVELGLSLFLVLLRGESSNTFYITPFLPSLAACQSYLVCGGRTCRHAPMAINPYKSLFMVKIVGYRLLDHNPNTFTLVQQVWHTPAPPPSE